MNSIIWQGRSGTAYSFVAHPLDGPLDDEGGIYIFARRNPAGEGWNAICVGEAASFSRELPAHPKRQCARNHAATHVHLWPQSDPGARRAAVRDLITHWHPPCNQILADAIAPREHALATG
jgi:hypothetical protein